MCRSKPSRHRYCECFHQAVPGTKIRSLFALLPSIGTYQCANDTTQIEDDPEPSNVSALRMFGWIRQHDDTLRSPQDSGAATQEESREDGVAKVASELIAKVCGDVDCVADATDSQGPSHANSVDHRAAQETHDCEGRV